MPIEPLAEDQHVAGARAVVALDTIRMHQPEHRQTVHRLGRIDRMAASDRDAGGIAHRMSTGKHALHRFHRQLAERHADQRQREKWLAAHRVNIGNRVGRGDAAEIVRVVDDRQKEIGGRDDRLFGVDAIHRRVVARFSPDQQVGVNLAERR